MEPLTDLSASLADIGAVVTPVSVYRWIRPPDQSPVRALVAAVRSGAIDALTFTSAPAVSSMLSTAKKWASWSGSSQRCADRYRPTASDR